MYEADYEAQRIGHYRTMAFDELVQLAYEREQILECLQERVETKPIAAHANTSTPKATFDNYRISLAKELDRFNEIDANANPMNSAETAIARTKLRRAMSLAPYSGSTRVPRPDEIHAAKTPAEFSLILARWVEGIATLTATNIERAHVIERERDLLKSQRQAAREWFVDADGDVVVGK